jgi:hypothetical protein
VDHASLVVDLRLRQRADIRGVLACQVAQVDHALHHRAGRYAAGYLTLLGRVLVQNVRVLEESLPDRHEVIVANIDVAFFGFLDRYLTRGVDGEIFFAHRPTEEGGEPRFHRSLGRQSVRPVVKQKILNG